MLRRAFLALGVSLAIPTLFKRVVAGVTVGELPLEDLSRVKIYGITKTGRRIDHKILWYGEFYNGRYRTVRICHSQDVPKNTTIKKLIFEIDGQVIQQFSRESDLDPGVQVNWSQFGSQYRGYKAPTAIRVDQTYTGFYKEVTQNIVDFGSPTD